jgi:deoxyribose-phosphate aldolase
MNSQLLSSFAARIDHTILKPETTLSQIEQLCQEAKQHKFAAVCFAPCWTNYVVNFLPDNDIKRATVIGFPHGNSFFLEKINAAQANVIKGANEIDVVVNIGFIKSGDWASVESEIELFGKMIDFNRGSFEIKFIVEVGYLTDDELYRVADLLIKHKIHYIKTCTGYGPRNVELTDIIKIKKHVGDAIKIKASGGIKDANFFLALLEVGADRIGSSSSVKIMEELKAMP